jgi:uncharacterized LabA/DUF88 family protein
MLFMDLEEVQFTSAQSPTNEPTNGQQEHASAPQNISSDQTAETAEATSTESSSSAKKRRRRPSRGGARHSHTSETEQHTDAPEHETGAADIEAHEEPGSPAEEAPLPLWASSQNANAPFEAPEASAHAAPFQESGPGVPAQETPDFFEAFAEAAALPTPEAPGEAANVSAWSFAYEPFTFAPEAPAEPAASAEPAESPAQAAQEAEAVAARDAAQTEESPYEPIRAPLSGVEVRPPRRYRFDRPAPVIHDLRRPALQAKPPVSPRAFGKAPTLPSPIEESAAPGATIERELTATPEIAAEVAAAEDLSRVTQAALTAEFAEEQAAPEQAPTPDETGAAPAAPEAPGTPASRRRRRRRSSSATASAAPAESAPEQAPASMVPAAPPAFAPSAPPALPPYQVSAGLQQLGQPQSPFSGPEPSSARGFGPVPRGVAKPAERSVQMPRQDRTVDNGAVSVNQLATIFTQAVQQQTDRLLMELRRNQGAPSMTVNFPPMPSTERVGVFVDVANLLYSARNMRISIDFGRLLDFLRGNRRLVRAHAYCPTSPDPRAEQMFLDAVKGLGYRITTKNYKTFSSGAKKADLDLDLCMDIVRLVDAGAVDCISLVSGDSDFLPLLEYCSDHGVRVEVAAFDEATASILRQSCDLFINLSLVEEIRA